MNTCKVRVKDKMVNLLLTIPEDEIESDDLVNDNTIDLTNELSNIEEKDK